MLIVVEGKSDEEFLRQYLLYKKIDISFKIIQNGGNGLNDETIRQIQRKLDDGEKVCIIFDADKSHNNTLNQLKKDLGNLSNEVDIFLFPNGKDNGELETLLTDIAKQPQFVKCFDNYVKCIESNDINIVDNIDKKSKMFAYREVVGLGKLLKKSPSKLLETKEIFSQYFNFDSQELKPLWEFLCK